MARPLSATTALTRFRRAGLDIREHDGWRTHNRNSAGSWGPVNGVAVHHYGPYSTEAGAVAYARRGSADLPGPLYHVLVARDGTVHLIGWGRANHAGRIDNNVLQALIAERSLPQPVADTVDGNARLYAVCLINRGDGRQTYPAPQLDAAAAVCAALCRAHDGWTERSVAGHKELTRRKIDPSFDMEDFRQRVRDRWDGLPPAADSTPPRRTLGQRVKALERDVARLQRQMREVA